MKVVPFLNQKGEQIGVARIAQDGLEAWITIDASKDVLMDLDGAVSIGYTSSHDAVSVRK